MSLLMSFKMFMNSNAGGFWTPAVLGLLVFNAAGRVSWWANKQRPAEIAKSSSEVQMSFLHTWF